MYILALRKYYERNMKRYILLHGTEAERWWYISERFLIKVEAQNDVNKNGEQC